MSVGVVSAPQRVIDLLEGEDVGKDPPTGPARHRVDVEPK